MVESRRWKRHMKDTGLLFVLCVALAIVVIELILWAIGWVLKIAISLAVVAGVVVVGGMLIIWLFAKLWPAFIILAVVAAVVVTFRIGSRLRDYWPAMVAKKTTMLK